MSGRVGRPRNRYPYQQPGGIGLLNEDILEFVLQRTNWNPFLLCACACVCKRLNELVKAKMWKLFCLSRAPKMANDLLGGVKNDAIEIGWDKLGKLMIFCAGCHATRHFKCISDTGGHLVMKSRFSRTSGKSFLHPKCRSDVLYVTDLCEHLDEEEDIGLFRGVFKSFGMSKTRQMLLEKRVELEKEGVCPFCRSRVWSMVEAKMIPQSAQRRLASYDYENSIEYFICINGHLMGMCVLLPLPESDEDDGGGGGGGGGDGGGGARASASGSALASSGTRRFALVADDDEENGVD